MTTVTDTRQLIMDGDYPAVHSAVGIARRGAERRLEVWGVPPSAIENISLVVSELVTNSVQAEGVSFFRLTLAQDVPGSITVEVSDSCGQEPQQRTPDPDDTCGRGLLIVDVLACHYGVRGTSGGKTVYAVLATDDPNQAPPV